jgi:hypothetical protein
VLGALSSSLATCEGREEWGLNIAKKQLDTCQKALITPLIYLKYISGGNNSYALTCSVVYASSILIHGVKRYHHFHTHLFLVIFS